MKKLSFLAIFLFNTIVSFASLYQTALSSFNSDCSSIWINSCLPRKMAKLKDGIAYVIFENLYRSDQAIVECDFSQFQFKIRKSDDSVRLLTKEEFIYLCKEPSLVAYNHRIYLNIPHDSVSMKESMFIGNLIAGGLYDIARNILKSIPQQKITIKFVLKNDLDVDVMTGRLSDLLLIDEVKLKVEEMLKNETYQSWKQKRQRLINRLPRKPSVVYGKRKFVFKRIDGVIEIPRNPPLTSKTLTWTEPVYSDGWGRGRIANGKPFNMHVRVQTGVRECSRTKPLTQMYDYAKLKAIRDRYDEAVRFIQTNRPPIINKEYVQEVISSGYLRFSHSK